MQHTERVLIPKDPRDAYEAGHRKGAQDKGTAFYSGLALGAIGALLLAAAWDAFWKRVNAVGAARAHAAGSGATAPDGASK